jgi:hypothetical protein
MYSKEIAYARDVIIEYLGEDVVEIVDISVKELSKNITARTGFHRYKSIIVGIILEINIATIQLDDEMLLRSVIEHEIVHIATEILNDRNQGHNEKFFAMAKVLGIETNEFRRFNE